jgi:hypothetical protein
LSVDDIGITPVVVGNCSMVSANLLPSSYTQIFVMSPLGGSHTLRRRCLCLTAEPC